MIIFKKPLVLFCEGEGGDGKGGGSNGGGGDNGGQGGKQEPTTIKIGEKIYTAEQIQALEGSAQAAQAIVQKAQQYGLDPAAFVSHSEDALGVVARLSQEGILKQDGTIDLSKVTPSKDKLGDGGDGGFFKQSGADDPAAKAFESINQTLSKFGERMEAVERGQSKLFEDRVRSKLKDRYPGLTDDDISSILTESSSRRKPLLEVAEARAGSMTEREKQIRDDERKKLAKEFGLDYEQLNKQKTLDPTQGAAVFTQGKKLSFKKEEGSVEPKAVVMEWLKAKGIGG